MNGLRIIPKPRPAVQRTDSRSRAGPGRNGSPRRPGPICGGAGPRRSSSRTGCKARSQASTSLSGRPSSGFSVAMPRMKAAGVVQIFAHGPVWPVSPGAGTQVPPQCYSWSCRRRQAHMIIEFEGPAQVGAGGAFVTEPGFDGAVGQGFQLQPLLRPFAQRFDIDGIPWRDGSSDGVDRWARMNLSSPPGWSRRTPRFAAGNAR